MTSTGLNMQGLIRQGSRVSFSMRGLGNVIKPDGEYKRVCSPLMIICYDWVVLPSHKPAYLDHMIREDNELSIQNNSVINEGSIITFDMNQLLRYVSNQSRQLQSISEEMEFAINEDYSNVSYDRENALVSIRENNEVLKVFLEKSLKREVDDYFMSRF